MKLCKKLLAVLAAAAMLLTVLVGSAAAFAEAERTPELPEGYDGFIVFSVEALPLGFDFLIPPTYVPFHEGETVAEVSMRVFEDYGLSYSAGDPDSFPSGFYLTSLEWPNLTELLEPNVPDYLMEQLIENYCYDEEEGWDQPEPENDMLSAGNYTYYSGWMIAENDVTTPVGAGEVPCVDGNTYRWMYSIYGYGMDIGMSDGWGFFPEFENPAMGVMRGEAYTLLADILEDDDLLAQIGAGCPAHEEYVAFMDAICYQGSTQEEIDAATAALAAALANGPEIIPGDVNGDGEITASDALIILRASMHLLELEGDAAAAADFNGDGTIDATDALLVLRASMSLV